MKKVLTAVVVLAVMAPAALASGASLKLSPTAVSAGSKVTVSGSVGKGCSVKKGSVATLYSKAFASKQNVAGVPSVSAPLSSKGSFSIKVPTKHSASGTYTVSGRCGGGKFGSAMLTVLVGAY
jgi:hypothetical protein